MAYSIYFLGFTCLLGPYLTSSLVARRDLHLKASSTCTCDVTHTSRRLTEHDMHQPGKVIFMPAPEHLKGDKYKRVPRGEARKQIEKGPRQWSSRVGARSQSLRSNTIDSLSDTSSCNSDQIHINLGASSGSMTISFASYGFGSQSYVQYSTSEQALLSASTDEASGINGVYLVEGTTESHSNLNYVNSYLYNPAMGVPATDAQSVLDLQNTYTWAYDKQTGEPWANSHNYTTVKIGNQDYNNPYVYYDSPLLSTVTLTGLNAAQTYYYRVAGSCDVFSFRMPAEYSSAAGAASPYPFVMGLTVDIGQTNVSEASMKALAAMQPSAVLCAGDLSYADGWAQLWDTFATLLEPLASKVPFITTGGNHEVGSAENWLSYRARYPTPYQSSGSSNFCYWGKEVGVVNVIALCSYAGFSSGSLQYAWLQNYLATSIDRTKTPWVAVMLHVPMYNSNNGHWMEGELMRLSVEPLLYQYGVDFVLAGHVHSYERTYPVYNSSLDECGPVHLNLGDGGNYEGLYTAWRFETDSEPIDWSAFREASFGVGGLTFHNSTHALFSWNRHACQSDSEGPPYYGMNFSANCVTPGDTSAQAMLTSDVTWLVRPPVSQCSNRWVSTATTDNVISGSGDSDNDALSTTVIALSVTTAVFGASTIVLSIILMQGMWGKSVLRETLL